jgi:hypothetical protein
MRDNSKVSLETAPRSMIGRASEANPTFLRQRKISVSSRGDHEHLSRSECRYSEAARLPSELQHVVLQARSFDSQCLQIRPQTDFLARCALFP